MAQNNPVAKAAGDKAVASWKNKDLNWKQFSLPLKKAPDCVVRVNDVAWRMWQSLEHKDESFLLAPFLIILPLANLHLGATGDAAKQLRDLLGFTDDEEEDIKLHKWYLYVHMRLKQQSRKSRVSPLNALLMRTFRTDKVKHDFRDCFMRYKREVKCLTLVDTLKNSETPLNRFTKKETFNKLKFACPLNYFKDETTMGMVSSLYFCGEWMNLPNDGYASIDMYYVAEKDYRQIPYLRAQTRADYYEYEDCTVCGFEYKWSSLALFVFKPKIKFGLRAFEETLTSERILHYIRFTSRRRVYKQYSVNVQLPLFTVISSFDVTEAVRKLPIPAVFDKNQLKLTNFSPDMPPVALEQVFQSVGIETTTKSGNLKYLVKEPKKFIPCLPPQKQFIVESPFLFVLYEHRAEIIVFIGRFIDPNQGEK